LDENEEFLEKLPAATFSARLKALYRLTGGNPRLLLILYQFLSLGELKDVLFYLNHILDEHSQYFLDKMKMLTNQQQAIIDAIAKSEFLIIPKEIAQITGMKINVVTAQISRLMDMGYLTPIKLSQPKNVTCYELGERIFRIWYQMRTGGRHRRRIQFLVTFLQIWYSQEELKRKIVTIEEVFFSLQKVIKDELITEPDIVSGAWFTMGYVYDNKGKYDEAIICYKQAVKIKPDKHNAWYNMANAYRNKGEYDEAIKCYENCIKFSLLTRIREKEVKEFGEYFIKIFKFILRQKRYEEADRLFRLCQEQAPKDLLDILYPIKITIDYLITGNKTLIEIQPIEFRETIEDILRSIDRLLVY